MLAQARRFANAQKSMKDMVRADAMAGNALFTASVSGNITARSLAALGHPFGRDGGLQRRFSLAKASKLGVKAKRSGRGKGYLPGIPINRQTGRLYSEVRAWQSDSGSWLLGSTVPYAKYVLSWSGTKTMVTRTKNGRPLIGGRLKGGPTMGLLEQHHRMRTKARRLALRQAHRKST